MVTTAPTGVRQKIDHEAIERDYRLGAFTLRELASKHGCSHQAIARMAKKKRWTQDLSNAVRAATNAALIEDAISSSVARSGQEVANTVLSAAEVNKQIVLGHRVRLAEVTAAANAVKAKVLTLVPEITEIRDAAAAMAAVESWSRISKTVIDKEREAFGLTSESNEETRPGCRVVIVPAKGAEA